MNDPLVHYTISDLTDPSKATLEVDTSTSANPMSTFGTRTFLNDRYRPWGGNPNKRGWDSYVLTLKDPAIIGTKGDLSAHSDDWDFPTNTFPNIGWLGRVHRGTPWQTVYLKSPSTNLATWATWSGHSQLVPYVGQFATNRVPLNTLPGTNGWFTYDGFISMPTNDWHILDLFTAALSDNATRGQLSINQTNLAAWSAVLSGVVALTNTPMLDPNGNMVASPWTIQPAGFYYPPFAARGPGTPATWPPVAQIVYGINYTRAAMSRTAPIKLSRSSATSRSKHWATFWPCRS